MVINNDESFQSRANKTMKMFIKPKKAIKEKRGIICSMHYVVLGYFVKNLHRQLKYG